MSGWKAKPAGAPVISSDRSKRDTTALVSRPLHNLLVAEILLSIAVVERLYLAEEKADP